jgi:MFS superfamily sulfate permease-like transporter
VIASLFAGFGGLQINFVNVPANLLDAVRFPSPAGWSRLLDGHIVAAGMAMALVASAETLLCATAVDQMHRGPRTNYDKELFAQGIGNAVCGLIGGLPMTGVIVRSSANVQAGGRTRVSAILHGLWLLIFVAALPFVLSNIPTASLAAILVFTGYKLVNPKAVRSLAKYGKGELSIYLVTLITIVVTDLLTGVLIGVGLSAGKLVYTFSHLDIRLEPSGDGRRSVLFLKGAATFISLPKLARYLETVAPSTELHVHFEALDYIDHACLDLLMNWETQHESTGGSLVMDWESLHARFYRESSGRSPLRRDRETAGGPAEVLVEPTRVA